MDLETDLISKRGQLASDWEDFLYKYMCLCINDPYDETQNPAGYVNLGTSVNNLCMDIIIPKLTCDEVWSCDTTLLQYREGYGTMRLREAFAKVLTEFFDPCGIINPLNIFCLTGVTSCIDVLAHCLADPGDVFLMPTPLYGRIYTDFMQRALVDVVPIPVITADNTEDTPVLTLAKVIKAYEDAVAKDQVVRGVFLINPNNPLGDIYSPELLMDILKFCHTHSLHIIIDEVYALSVYSKTQIFHSVLKFCELPDPQRTHVLYGMSKDFGMAGFRIGMIHTKCEALQKCLMQLSFFQNIPFPIMEIAARYLEDLDWIKEYVAINQQRLGEKSEYCKDFFKKMDLKVRDTPAGFFLWIDFRNVCGSSFQQEMHFFKYLIEKAHLYIGPGNEFLCAQPGWFRLVFSESPHQLAEGLSRLEKALKEYEPLNV